MRYRFAGLDEIAVDFMLDGLVFVAERELKPRLAGELKKICGSQRFFGGVSGTGVSGGLPESVTSAIM